MTAPDVPSLKYVFTIEADITQPRSSGSGPNGRRLHIAITGGRVFGPRLTGRVLPGGSDWPVIRPDGNSVIEAHYTIEADDGTLVYVRNRGLRVSDTATLDLVKAGKPVPTAAFYMRTAPIFDAPDGAHGWLNTCLFVCSARPLSGSVRLETFRVT
jgi:hypothetical protein